MIGGVIIGVLLMVLENRLGWDPSDNGNTLHSWGVYLLPPLLLVTFLGWCCRELQRANAEKDQAARDCREEPQHKNMEVRP
jgi:hypothetical protein